MRVVCVFLIIIIYLLAKESTGFNLDLSSYVLYSGDKNSMFGYSVTLHKRHNRSWVVAGAPKAKFLRNGVEYSGGSAYACEAFKNDSCQRIHINFKGKISSKAEYITTDQWLGGRVESLGEDGPLLICAPRLSLCYQGKNNVDGWDDCVLSGICFLKEDILGPNTMQTINPCGKLLKGNAAAAFCQAGFSTLFSKEKNKEYLYIGSPSHMKRPNTNYIHAFDLRTLSERSAYKSHFLDKSDVTYFQYSLVGLKYGKEGGIVGASIPRGALNVGKVMLFSSSGAILMEFVGEQMGAYFGYAMCSTDLNGDGDDDLIISAPMHTVYSSGKIETGRIYVYIQNKLNFTFAEPVRIDGLVSRSRFGTALISLNDIDLDGYGDFAVGAPYDGLDNRGAVYIYRGTQIGPSLRHSQVIYAENFPNRLLSGFGFSLHSGVDVDGNSYPDLIVGAYDSDAAILLRSRPVIILKGSISFNIEEISLDTKNCTKHDLKVSCTNFKSSISYSGRAVPQEIDLIVSWSLDVEKKQEHRMFFSDHGVFNFTHSSVVTLRFQEIVWINHQVYINPQLQDKLSPIIVEMQYELLEKTNNEAKDDALPSPILEPLSQRPQHCELRIERNCGADDICIPDLQLSVRTSDNYTLGSSEPLTLEIMIANKGEDAYEAALFMSFLDKLYFRRVQQINSTSSSTVACSTSSEERNTVVKCNIGNPFLKGKFINFTISLNPSDKYDNIPTYTIDFNVNSTNSENETTKSDNALTKSIEIVVGASLSFNGATRENRLLYDSSKSTTTELARLDEELGPEIVHWYSFRNQGPAPIIQANVYIIWPSKTLSVSKKMEISFKSNCELNTLFKGKHIIYLLTQPKTTDKMSCMSTKFNELNLAMNRTSLKISVLETDDYSNETSIEISETPKLIHSAQLKKLLHCRNFQCSVLNCTINGIIKDEEASLIMRTRLVVSSLSYLAPSASIEFSNRIVTKITELPYLEDLSDSDEIYSYEVAYTVVPEKDRIEDFVPLWIIIVSSTFGTVLLLICVYLLHKCGFFKRIRIPKSEEVDLMDNAE